MSSKANRMAKTIPQKPQETKEVRFRVDVVLDGIGPKTTYIIVAGVPKDLPAEYQHTVKHAAEMQLSSSLNAKLFMEFYNSGKDSRSEQPVFYNLSLIKDIRVESITEIKDE